ncbi:MAG: nucleotidyl transferase AbiEii/AbiGii toxin family protein [Saprospiraceae bacterium]
MSKRRVTIYEVKKLVIIALVSDDYLMETLVLKGGNALQLGYDLSHRASFDFDFSMSEDFQDIQEAAHRIKRSLLQTFKDNGLHVFDFSFNPRPRVAREATGDFWGGYLVQFKFIELDKLKELGADNPEELRKQAIPVYPNHSPKIDIEISKFEYVDDKKDVEIEGYTVRVYAPRLLVFEKVRAICQQLEDYAHVVPSFSPRARFRDFYDIYTILEHFDIDLDAEQSKDIFRNVFDAKKVPFGFLKKMRENRELHKQDFASLADTVSRAEKENLKDFDFYFDYVIEKFESYLD